MERAIAYLRTSSAANVDGDSASRQNAAIMAYAERAGITVDSCFWDAAVSGVDAIEARKGFAAVLDHAAASGIRVVLVEDPSRFARSMIPSELGLILLAARGVRLVTASGQDLSDASDPAKVMLRQVAAAFAQYEKAKLVEKLASGRAAKRATGAKCEGRKSVGERKGNEGLERQARRLARRNPKTGRVRSLREIAAELATLGFRSNVGTPLSPSVVRQLVT